MPVIALPFLRWAGVQPERAEIREMKETIFHITANENLCTPSLDRYQSESSSVQQHEIILSPQDHRVASTHQISDLNMDDILVFNKINIHTVDKAFPLLKTAFINTTLSLENIYNDLPLIDADNSITTVHNMPTIEVGIERKGVSRNFASNPKSSLLENNEQHLPSLAKQINRRLNRSISYVRKKTYDGHPIFRLGEKASGLRPQGEVQDFDSIRNGCLSSGSLFEDPLFPASNESLMFSRRPDRYIEWMRPHEIADDPQFFVEGYSRFDVQQGELGDCWLLAAAANLTQDSNLFFRVVPPDQSFEENYAGVFHFCFWQYGKWIDVVIDDRLPTYRGELLYMHSTEKNEFWSALLEKAYAKLHGSYEALKGGTTCEAMEDFTGGVTEWYDLKEAPPNLFNILYKAMERNSMMGCSLEPDPNVLEAETPEGLIRGHAYSITKVCLIDIVTPNRQGKIPMVRMRNPWGNEAEWNGPWSDSSPEWRYIPEDQKLEIGLTFDRDGEFWMSFQDFLNHFDRVEICNLSPDSLTEDQMNSGKRKWEMSMFEGEWTPGATAGGCRNYLETFWHNPQYVISLTDPDEEDEDGKCTVIVALMQKNRRSKRNMGMECLTIGFAIYHLTDRDLETRPQGLSFFKYRASVARSPHFINTREVCARFKLPPGHYLIIPSTFDPNEEGEFIIRVFSETQNNMEENDDHVGYGDVDDRITPALPPPKAVDPQRDSLMRLFKSIAGADMEVDWMELKRILDHSMRDDLPKGPYLQNATTGGFGAPKASNGTDGFGNNGQGGGGGEGGGSGNLLAMICGPFCKGTPFENMFNDDQPASTALLSQNQASDPNGLPPSA